MRNVLVFLPQGTSVLQVTAQDGDLGSPNPIEYSFVSGSHDAFSIDAQTGVISVARQLDREDPAIRELFGSLDMHVQVRRVFWSMASCGTSFLSLRNDGCVRLSHAARPVSQNGLLHPISNTGVKLRHCAGGWPHA